jgi:hypothetical protein
MSVAVPLTESLDGAGAYLIVLVPFAVLLVVALVVGWVGDR